MLILLLLDKTLRGAYNYTNGKIGWAEIAAAKYLGQISYSLHVPSGCANLWVCRLVHGENASSVYMEPGGSLYTVCVHPCKIMEVDGLKAIVENSPLMFWHVAKILLSRSASFHTGQSVPAAVWDLSPASASLMVLKRARSSCVQSGTFVLFPHTSKWE